MSKKLQIQISRTPFLSKVFLKETRIKCKSSGGWVSMAVTILGLRKIMLKNNNVILLLTNSHHTILNIKKRCFTIFKLVDAE